MVNKKKKSLVQERNAFYSFVYSLESWANLLIAELWPNRVPIIESPVTENYCSRQDKGSRDNKF